MQPNQCSAKRIPLGQDNYERVIDFCLKTRRNPNTKDLQKARLYFHRNFGTFRKLLFSGDIAKLRELVGKAPGVGQKIGAFILEVFILYGNNNPSLQKKLFVPLDAHTLRMFREALKIPDVPQKTTIGERELQNFQYGLDKYIPLNGSRIYFDFLWFIGKVFCQKITKKEKSYSRGYRLCNICWIKDYCKIEEKWELNKI